MRIAIVGTGIAGMTVARRLYLAHQLTVYEANAYVGGHTATVDVERHGQPYAIDTGFIVYNDWTYPNFIALLDEIGVESQASNMSFSFGCERTGLEYNGTSINSLFAQRRNVLRPSFLRMIADILRFNSRSRSLLAGSDDALTLGEYLREHHYSRAFTQRYIVPMGKAIWSATESTMLGFPVRFFVEFFEKHGFLNISNRPTWRTIAGGSREYARQLVAPFRNRILLSTPVAGVQRSVDHVSVRSQRGDVTHFDAVIFACHSDQALKILEDPSPQEREILGAFPYQENEALLHTDERMLPRNRRARAAWNYHALSPSQERVALTYDMNVLMSLNAPEKFLVTLNRSADIEPSKVLGRYVYHHPVYTPGAVAAQRRRNEISGVNRSYYCGAYWRYGFHEDGVVSAGWALDDFTLPRNA